MLKKSQTSILKKLQTFYASPQSSSIKIAVSKQTVSHLLLKKMSLIKNFKPPNSYSPLITPVELTRTLKSIQSRAFTV